MNIALALGCGVGLGFFLGCLFARLDQGKMFGLVSQTSDSLVRSALFPGVPKEVFDSPRVQEPAEDMYETATGRDEAVPRDQGWLYSEDPPWDVDRADAS